MDLESLTTLLSSTSLSPEDLTKELKPASEYLSNLSTESDELIPALEQLALASRTKENRLPIGDSGVLLSVASILDTVLAADSSSSSQGNEKVIGVCLRILGNSCAEIGRSPLYLSKTRSGS